MAAAPIQGARAAAAGTYTMRELDKIALGKRVREIRQQAGLRQWELALRLGTTQSAVHKYEHGVVPEPRRLLELARIGDTTIEWILTGRHWEGGEEERRRFPPDVLRTARLLCDTDPHELPSIAEAMGILRSAALAVGEPSDTHAAARLLDAASRIREAILSRVAEDAASRLESSSLHGGAPSGAPPVRQPR